MAQFSSRRPSRHIQYELLRSRRVLTWGGKRSPTGFGLQQQHRLRRASHKPEVDVGAQQQIVASYLQRAHCCFCPPERWRTKSAGFVQLLRGRCAGLLLATNSRKPSARRQVCRAAAYKLRQRCSNASLFVNLLAVPRSSRPCRDREVCIPGCQPAGTRDARPARHLRHEEVGGLCTSGLSFPKVQRGCIAFWLAVACCGSQGGSQLLPAGRKRQQWRWMDCCRSLQRTYPLQVI